MLKPGDGSLNWPALIGLIVVLAILATVIWRAEMGEEITLNVRARARPRWSPSVEPRQSPLFEEREGPMRSMGG